MKQLERAPGTERPHHCDDWSCPARVSCARHFGRSRDYAAMKTSDRTGRCPRSVGHGPGTWYFRGIKESCPHYEFDRIKPWLTPHPGQVTHLPDGIPW